ESSVIPDYLMKVRWFGGKGRTIQRINIIDQAGMQLVDKYNSVFILIEVQYESGLPDIYQLAVSFARDHSAHKLQENCPKSVIANLKVGNEEGLLYDGLFGLDLQQEIIKKMANQETMTLKNSKLHFYSNKGLKKYVKAQEKIRSSILSAEQSNTSLTYDNQYFLKIYRKVDYAINPDMEITHFLTEKSNFKNIPAFVGAIEWKYKKGTIVMGMMQELVDNQGDAWSYMLDRVNNFYEEMLSRDEIGSFSEDMITGQEIELITLLGKRTGEMHIALAAANDDPEFQTEPFSLHYQRSLFSSFQSLVRETFQNQSKSMKRVSEELRKEIENV